MHSPQMRRPSLLLRITCLALFLGMCCSMCTLAAAGRAEGGSSQSSRRLLSGHLPKPSSRRPLQQAPAPSNDSGNLLEALQSIQSSLPPGSNGTGGTMVAAAPANVTANGAAPAPATDGGSPTAVAGPGPCTDPSLLTSTMSTFCKLDSLDQLASISQDAVQACCRLTSATLQPGCWDACSPPPAVSQQVRVRR